MIGPFSDGVSVSSSVTLIRLSSSLFTKSSGSSTLGRSGSVPASAGSFPPDASC